MERQTRLFIIALALLACSASVLADIIVADFVERRDGRNYSSTTGKLYYKYDGTTRTNSRLRFEYKIDSTTTVSNLYHYKDGAMYSMCSTGCNGILITEGADPWFYDSKFYNAPAAGYPQTLVRNKYLVTDKLGAQVTSVVMQSSDVVKEVHFVDGRHITLSNFKKEASGYDAKFEPDASLSCPKATCPIYADLIFVLDNSGSVDNSEWRQTANFVNAVMDTFTFGDDAAEAAIIQFNAPYHATWCSEKVVDNCWQCYTDFTFYTSYSFPGYATATVFAGKDYGNGKTVSELRDSLKTTMSGSRPSMIGNTCQGYGLELVKTVLDLNPRRRYGKRPQPIVIAVTDGADMCPNKTANAAEELRKKYDAFVIEVGVGMYSGCNNYDKKFLQRIASKIGSDDNPAYYDVTDYNAIRTLSDKLFKPLCDGFNAACGPDCLGFCGCGKCFCPTCDNLQSTCEKVTCVSDGSTSTGCAKTPIPCEGTTNICQWYDCDGTKTGSERCTLVHNQCPDLKKANPGKCRENSTCTVSGGGCSLTLNHAYCQQKYGDECVEYECTPAGQKVPDDMKDSGCRLKANHTKEIEDKIKKEGRTGCAYAKCDKNKGASEATTCKTDFPKCYTPVCNAKSGTTGVCSEVALNRPPDDKCRTYNCPDKNDGWKIASEKTEDICIAEIEKKYGANSSKCQRVYCEGNIGCTNQSISGCSSECTSQKTKECQNQGTLDSTDAHCILGVCQVVKQGTTSYDLTCDYEQYVVNCNDEMFEQLKYKNKINKDTCYTAKCEGNGKCGMKLLPDHADTPVDNYCTAWQCKPQNDKTWKWEYTDTLMSLNCVNDTCGFRYCDPSKPECQVINKTCEIRSNVCASYKCNVTVDDDTEIESRLCVETSYLKDSKCIHDVCNKDGTAIIHEDNLTSCSINLTDPCMVPKCFYDEKTQESYCYYEERQPPETDPCKIYHCYSDDDNKTAKFTSEPKCVDDSFCTENICTIFGECKFPPVKCLELPMDGYPCFERRCRENETNYYCVRKLIPNAYIDVCGNCIMEDTSIGSVYSSESVSSESEVDLLVCTGAPPRPLLTEGLAAATVALIIIGAVVIGGGITASSIMGTKTLIARAKAADNQSAHTNPLFQDNEAEMSNPAFIEEKDEV